jgi:hypothetical protein
MCTLIEQVTTLLEKMTNIKKTVTDINEHTVATDKKITTMGEHFEQQLATLGKQLTRIQDWICCKGWLGWADRGQCEEHSTKDEQESWLDAAC